MVARRAPVPAPDPTNGSCPVTRCLDVIGGKWKPVILHLVTRGANRFGVLQRSLPRISRQSLTRQLRELERDGVLTRTVLPVVPSHVEYALTARGESLLGVVSAMREWGERHPGAGSS